MLTIQEKARPAAVIRTPAIVKDEQRIRPRALLVTADASTGARVTDYLERGGFEVHVLASNEAALAALARARPHVVMLDLQAQPEAMLALCHDLRQATPTPIIACSLNHDLSLIVGALQAGADDCFVLPMQTPEFVARVRAVVRRVRRARATDLSADRIAAGDVEVRLHEHRAYRNGRLLALTPTEFRLLTVLVRHCGRALSHSRLLKQAWGTEYAGCRPMLRIYIRRLRAKLGDDLDDPELLVAVRGVGYRFDAAVNAAPSAA